MANGKKATQAQKDNMKGRLTAMKNAAGGTPDKAKFDAAVAEGATFEEKLELVREARRIEPDLDLHAAADVAEEFYDEETSGREAARRAAAAVDDEAPRDAPQHTGVPPQVFEKTYDDPDDPTPQPPQKGGE
jgi:hypothetical protein